ncbi:hypothetical protein P154DRAFT_526706 [Amniculicola lignicola CBS 123094]|uniref:Uncharacterized protein n=1 Tax=Amniculicola lignicola CBS 123094 TaxID=1392246 RepID=A0A6A5W0U4_9PLEO|nr:hypothetical protein P154DRAFT_526706 [Amniculicola lignicola CBS 123094]
MKPAQIVGLSVAAAATFIVAIGLMVLSVFLRRRRERKRAAGGIEEGKVSKDTQSTRKSFFQRFSNQGFDKIQSPQIGYPEKNPPPRFPYPAPQTPSGGSPASRGTPYSNAYIAQTNPKTSVYSLPPGTGMPRSPPKELKYMHPALRPEVGNNSSSASLPLSQIGVAISAELPANPAAGRRAVQVPRRAELRQPRPKSLRPSSTMTQDTVFEEDGFPERRRSSTLLPTPPIPIPPIRSFQPSRPPPALKLVTQPSRATPQGQPASQQPGLSLNIPVRHSRFQPTHVAPASVPSLAPAIVMKPTAPTSHSTRSSSLYDQHKSISTTVSTPGRNIRPHVPDYHYTSFNNSSPKYQGTGLSPFSKLKDSPKVVSVKSKASSSTLSHPPSRGSTPNVRDSISSQTSFESMDSNDSTPDDEDKQLDETRLSPVAESPISNLRYPKVPRASNQLVPRSPKSPQSPQMNHFLHDLPEPSALLVKRRGEKEALRLESRLHMNSPPQEKHVRPVRSHARSNSMEAYNLANPAANTSKSRARSGQWPKSPAMYEMDEVRPLNIRAREPPTPGFDSLKSPAWVPNLTPTRRGDDLMISVTYSPPPTRPGPMIRR